MNAIILAAGLGSRFHEITQNNHKALLPIDGIPNIERTIGYLHEFGIEDITIVVGHMHHLFDYLKDKYHVRLIYNEHYADYNNLYSFYKAMDHFSDTYMIDADVVLFRNVFERHTDSCYYVVQRPKSEAKEWCPRVENGRVVEMEITNEEKESMLGISYWKKEDCELIKKCVIEKMNISENYTNPKYYWDNIPLELFTQMKVTVHSVNTDEVDEMDTYENYQDIQIKLEKYKSKSI